MSAGPKLLIMAGALLFNLLFPLIVASENIAPEMRVDPEPKPVPKTCNWCVFGRIEITEKVIALARMPAKKALAKVRSEGICVKVMKTGRLVPKDSFAWGKVEKPSMKAAAVTKLTGVMGKSMCKGEHELSKSCQTIFLASDAPFTTLLHEYLHVLQARRDSEWCDRSAALWRRTPNPEDIRAIRDKEWDVHLLLWHNRFRLPLTLDDKIAISSEIVQEAEQRKSFDPAAEKFLVQERPQAYMEKVIQEYKSQMGIKK